ncbi:MAG: tRNA pseudouridine synthase A [Defluviitaleaceae bacterium]|nr:tRNA pseudouridine synthase A [Defluviitaleaceae bacterium]
MTILLTVAYDGTNYAGWQRQNNAIAVQQLLEEALSSFFKKEIKTTASSRTDAGVHALGQRVAFDVDDLIIPQDKVEKLATILNTFLPDDIVIQAVKIVESGFNPRFCAKSKTYCYQIYNDCNPNPLLNRYSAFEARDLDVQKMSQAALHFVGTHNFSAFVQRGQAQRLQYVPYLPVK